MKKQTNPNIKAHLIQSAFYVLLLLAICAIPFALAQSNSRGTRHDLSAAAGRLSQNAQFARIDAETESMAPATLAPAVVAYVPNAGSNNVTVIDTANNAVIATVGVGNSPIGAAVKLDGTRAYVTNFNSNDVSVIDTSTNTVIATVAVGSSPRGVAVKPDNSRAYVTNFNSGNVSVIDTSNNTVITTVMVGLNPIGVALKPNGSRAYVANQVSNNVSVIDTSTNNVVATVAVGSHPHGVALKADGTRAYVANEGSNSVSVIDTSTNTVVATVGVNDSPSGVALNSDGSRAYVANQGSNNVSVIDTATNTLVATVGVNNSPSGVTLNPNGTRVYVANAGSDTLSVIDTVSNTVVNTVTVGDSPVALGNFVGATHQCPMVLAYVANGYDNDVSVIDTANNTFVARVPVGSTPGDLAINPDGTRLYVSHASVDFIHYNVLVIDTSSNTVVGTITFPSQPGNIAVNPDGTRLYVTNYNTVSVVDTSNNTVVATWDIGAYSAIYGIAVKPDGTRIYVVNQGRDNRQLSVIDTSHGGLIATVEVDTGANGVAVTPDGNLVYVAGGGNFNPHYVSVIETVTNNVVATFGQELYGATDVAITPDGARAYVTRFVDAVSVIDTFSNTVVATVNMVPYSGAGGVAVTPDGASVYVTNGNSNTVSVIDTSNNTVVARFPVGRSPGSLAIGTAPCAIPTPTPTPTPTATATATPTATATSTATPTPTATATATPTATATATPTATATATATPSPTATATATPTPTATATPGSCQFRVLIAYADYNGRQPTALRDEILADRDVSAVDLFDARVGTPTLAQLQQYDIVMPFSNGPFADDITLGDNLADYVDGGGVVVQCAMSFLGPDVRGGVNGRWVTGNYNPYNYSTDAGSTEFSAYIDDPAHPLMAGVTTLNCSFLQFVTVPAGATRVASALPGGYPLVAYRPVSGGHTTVGITAFLGFNAQSGDWGKLIVNAGRWLLPCGGTPRPTPTPTPTPAPCQFRVLIAYADYRGRQPTEIRGDILADPDVAAVDLFDASVGTPTLAQLQQYDIVMPFSNGPFADDITLGNNLADYVDGGGVVVQCAMSFLGPDVRGGVNGRWVTGNYNAYNYSTEAVAQQFTAYIHHPEHPLMAGVTSLNGGFLEVVTLATGATRVASALVAGGPPLVAYRPVSGGHTTVGIAAFLGFDDQSGDWGKLIVNAGRWLRPCGGTPTPTPTATPSPTPTATPTATATPIATPTPTPTATPTSTPTATPTATATATPIPTPVAPNALKATDVTATSFTANWSRVSVATGYRLDVSTSSVFNTYVPGYQNLDVGNTTSYNVSGLNPSTFYHYRVRAYNLNGTSPNSNVVKVRTKNG